MLKRNAEILLLQRILKSGCDFALAGSQKVKNGQDLASTGDLSAKIKCDLASAGDQHIKEEL